MNKIIIIILFGIITVFSAIGALFLKKGSKNFNLNILQQIKNKDILLGIFLYVFFTPIYIYFLKLVNLSLLYPISSLTYVWVSLLSMKFLKEKMNKYKWIGVFFIILGIFLTTYSKV